MASPQVAGLAGKILAVNPKLKPTEVTAMIEKTADKIADGHRPLINPKKAIAAASAKGDSGTRRRKTQCETRYQLLLEKPIKYGHSAHFYAILIFDINCHLAQLKWAFQIKAVNKIPHNLRRKLSGLLHQRVNFFDR